jgi:hypothetical protein
MSDPKRLLEENTDEFENELLRSVRADVMTDRNRQRIMAGIGLATAGLTASTAAASTGAAVKAGFFKGVSAATVKWIAICSVAALVPTGVWVARSHRTVSLATVTAAAAPDTAPAPRVAATPSPTIETAAPAVEPAPDPKPAPVAQPAPAALSNTLADEVAALEVARAALRAHDPSGAIVALDRYKSRFPAGKLAQEATVVRIEALNQRGDRAAAAVLGDRFLAAHPNSPYADRVRAAAKGAAK